MKISLNFPPDGEKDAFSRDLARAEWIFKFVGWIILIGTLQYAAVATDHGIFRGVAFGLTLEICWLANSFVSNRLTFIPVSPEGQRPKVRLAINLITAATVGFIAWQIASKVVFSAVSEIVEFQTQAQSRSKSVENQNK